MRTRRTRRAPAALCALATLMTTPTGARAEALLGSTWSEQARREIEGDLESPELRALRLMEQSLFAPGPEQSPVDYDPDCAYGVPDAFSSDVPPERLERAGQEVDLRWLGELKLPNIPVRWDERVIDYLLFFKDNKRGHALLASWLKRQERYGPLIRKVLAQHSLPSDLQYVAMVESGYDPVARSAASAQGLWQFMKRAATHYGLRIDRWVDQRHDPRASTEAAARYLKSLYNRFGGWELAMAAYNMGYGGLLRSIRKYNTNDYWVLSHVEAGLPFETALYVSKITAVAIVANNPERFGFGDLNVELPEAVSEVKVPAGTLMKPIARAVGIPTDELMALNPELKRKRVPPGDGPWALRIPAERESRFLARWARHHKPQQYESYAVKFGESLEDVARRFGIRARTLRRINELSTEDELHVGELVMVPSKGEVKTENGELPVATVPDAEFAYADRRRVFYRVASHDTVESVARFFRVQADELRSWNQVTEGAFLQKGMLLQVFVAPDLDVGRAVVLTPDQVKVLVVGSEAFFDFHEGQRGRVRVRYKVQDGDTVKSIGKRFELSAGSVGRINQFSKRKELSAGDWIVVYVPEEKVPRLERKGLVERFAETLAPARSPDTESTAAPDAAGASDTSEDGTDAADARGEQAAVAAADERSTELAQASASDAPPGPGSGAPQPDSGDTP